jgi:hypothetical protein
MKTLLRIIFECFTVQRTGPARIVALRSDTKTICLASGGQRVKVFLHAISAVSPRLNSRSDFRCHVDAFDGLDHPADVDADRKTHGAHAIAAALGKPSSW